MDIEFVNTLVRDIGTYMVMSRNSNYKERLKEAYDYIKSINIKDYEDFKSREDLLVGAFGYDEITIFDRLKDDEYKKVLLNAISYLDINRIKRLIDSKTLGDYLASYGELGYTPMREKLITRGEIVYGSTNEGRARRYK